LDAISEDLPLDHPMRTTSLLLLVLACACGQGKADPEDPAVVDPDPVDTDVSETDALDSDTLDTETLDSDTLDSDTLDSDTLDTDTLDTLDTDGSDTDGSDTDDSDTDTVVVDQDGDGSPLGVDCDDLDPLRSPGAEERCDGVDNDCDGDSADVGAASWLPAFGPELPLTDDLAAGTIAAPVVQSFTTSGTLLLCEGTHYVRIQAENNAAVTVRGTTGRAAEVVVHGGGGAPLTAMGGVSRVQVSDVTLTGAEPCLHVQASSTNAATNVVFAGCGVRTDVNDAVLELTDTELDGAGTSVPGLLGEWSSVTLLRVDVHDYVQGGLVFGATGAVNILQSDVHDNRSDSDGGGISLDLNSAVAPVTITMTGTTLQRNHAAWRGGGLFLRKQDALPVILDGGHVRANTSGFGSAGLLLQQRGVEVRNLTLSDHASGAAIMGLPTGTWSNITCVDNAEDCIYALGVGAGRSWTLVDSTLHSTGRYAINLSDLDTLTLSNIDFGVGATENTGDIYYDGGVFDATGVFSGTCLLPGGCG
jgi:hypothetical protein